VDEAQNYFPESDFCLTNAHIKQYVCQAVFRFRVYVKREVAPFAGAQVSVYAIFIQIGNDT
jgi:hypothetical protein